MKRSVLLIAAALSLIALSVSAASPPSGELEFRPASLSPFEVGGHPVEIRVSDLSQGDGQDDLAIIDSDGRLLLYENEDGKHLRMAGSAKVGDSAAGLEMVDGYSFDEFATVNPKEDTLTYLKDPYERPDKLHVAGKVTVGNQPSSLTSLRDPGGRAWPSNEPAFAVSNRGDDSVSLVSFGKKRELAVTGEVPVGDAPSDLAANDTLDVLVTNEGSGDVTLVSGSYSGENDTLEFRATQTLPAGNSPAAVISTGARPGNEGIAYLVVNEGSNTVTTYGWDGDQLEVLESIRVGDRPAAISSFRTGVKGLSGYVVTNRGSNDVSILTGSGGSLDPAGRFKAGSGPTAITPLIFSDFFSPDLAVANTNSGKISMFLWHETSGVCMNHPARLFQLTSENDDSHRTASGDPDRVLAGAGNDQIEGGSGGDCIYGQSGNDLIGGGQDADLVSGGSGNDRLSGRGDPDIIKGGPGNDRICEKNWGTNYSCWTRIAPYQLRVQKNQIDGGPGRDLIDTDGGKDRIDGGPGRDRILADESKEEPRFQSPDRIDCGSGRDVAVVDRLDTTRNCEKVTVK